MVVGVAGKVAASEDVGPLVVTKIRDPNVAYPLRQKEVVASIGMLYGKKFTTNTFQAVCRKFGFKQETQYCWKAVEGVLTKYSNELVPRIKSLTEEQVQDALTAYKTYTRGR